MLVVRYSSEAERKRLEYLLDKWRDRVRVEKPSGAILFIDTSPDNMISLVEELYSKIPREKVSIYQLREPEFQLEPLSLEGVVRTRMSPEEAWGALNLVLARLRGILVSETRGERTYTVSTKKGVARVRVSIMPGPGGSILRFVAEGYGEAVVHVYNRLVQELSYIGEVEGHEREL